MKEILYGILGLGAGLGIGYLLKPKEKIPGPVTNLILERADMLNGFKTVAHIWALNIDTNEHFEFDIISEPIDYFTQKIPLHLPYGNYNISIKIIDCLIKTFAISIDGTDLILPFNLHEILSDTNNDNIVDGADYTLWTDNYMKTGDSPLF